MPSKLDDYDVLYTIGSGSYGTCKKIRRKKDDKILLWKEMDYGTMSEEEKQLLVSEVNLLRELRHPHIVRYYDRIIDKARTTIYIVMEYCEGGDLSHLISKCRREGRYLEEDFIWKMLVQLLKSLAECHKRQNGKTVLHRDLKPANVFLDSSRNAKLGDFGLARVLHHDTSMATTFVGTPYYMSPEQMSRTSYNEKSDVWSLGCLLYELCALRPPFTAANQKELAVKIRVGRYHRIPGRYSDALAQVLHGMLKVKDEDRPTIESLLSHAHVVKRLSRDSGICQQSQRASITEASSGASNDSEKKDTETWVIEKEAELRKWEEKLKDRAVEVEKRDDRSKRREKQLDNREKALDEREKLAEEKIQRAQQLCKEAEAKSRTATRLSTEALTTKTASPRDPPLATPPSSIVTKKEEPVGTSPGFSPIARVQPAPGEAGHLNRALDTPELARAARKHEVRRRSASVDRMRVPMSTAVAAPLSLKRPPVADKPTIRPSTATTTSSATSVADTAPGDHQRRSRRALFTEQVGVSDVQADVTSPTAPEERRSSDDLVAACLHEYNRALSAPDDNPAAPLVTRPLKAEASSSAAVVARRLSDAGRSLGVGSKPSSHDTETERERPRVKRSNSYNAGVYPPLLAAGGKDNLKERLFRAKMRALELRNAEIEAKIKTRHLLGIH